MRYLDFFKSRSYTPVSELLRRQMLHIKKSGHIIPTLLSSRLYPVGFFLCALVVSEMFAS